MMHCAINSTQAVAWQDGEKSPTFTPTFTADWDGGPYLLNVVGTIPTYMPFAGWPAIDQSTWKASQPKVI